MNCRLSLLPVLLATLVVSADDRPRLPDIEQAVREALETENKAAFFEMFHSAAGEEREKSMREEIRDMFARHFRSGLGKVIVVPLQGERFRKETMGWLNSAGLQRAPGPPFAYLELYPADENDPDYMGLSMRLSKIDGKVRIVYPELQTDVPEALSGKLSQWRRADGTEFWAQFRQTDGEKARFRDENFELMEIDLNDLSTRDRSKIEKMSGGTKKR